MLFFNKISKKKRLLLKTTVITTMAASIIALSNGPVALATSSKLTTIYHVYLNDAYMGNVTDKTIIDNIITEKADTMKESFKGVDLKIGEQVQYISEQVFQSTANNQNTVQSIKNNFQIQAEAIAIVIDGQPVVYLDNKITAEEVMKKLKQQYVSEAQLNELAAKASAETALPPLLENETRILDVQLSKKVSMETKNIAPEKIIPAEEAVMLLQRGTLAEKKYAIQEGDVLETIAQDHDLKMADILVLNPDLTEESLLKIGQEINTTVLQPFVEVIVEKEVNQKEDIPFGNEVIEDSSSPKGETKVKQKGQNGSQSVTYMIAEQNGVTVKKDISNKQILQQPINQIVVKGTKEIPSRGEGNFAWPTSGGYVSSNQGYRWGKLHKGIDIARPSNKTIKATDNGVIVSAGWDGGYGNKIIIDHQNGYRSLYGHMSSLNVKVGQTVSKGTSIGVMGSTGDSTGVHLHFEVYKNGGLVNPLSLLR
ncbi:MAG: peptidoglycan DD-metalloendopeptidase family protein [Bacillus sp. (in: Bacteria)]|nr:peptidoglycan DD-metalloendopeptidase family protein [Bacillus sp. (in: firmicutes)]